MDMQKLDNILKVRGDKEFQNNYKEGKTYVRKLASAILTVLDKYDEVKLKTVGASSVNNAMKAFIVARSMSKNKQIDLVCTASFDVAYFDGDQKTAIVLTIFIEDLIDEKE